MLFYGLILDLSLSPAFPSLGHQLLLLGWRHEHLVIKYGYTFTPATLDTHRSHRLHEGGMFTTQRRERGTETVRESIPYYFEELEQVCCRTALQHTEAG
jgi:hypothetical protein